MNKRIIIFAAFLFFVFCFRASAETIYLRDGRILNEKIIEKGPYYIITQSGNMPHKYYTGQIKKIEGDEVQDTMDMSNLDLEQFESIGMSAEKAKLVAALINVSGVRKNMEEQINQIISKVPEEQKEYYRKIFNIDEIVERLIPLYDRYYSEKELLDTIHFYDSPAGRKVLEVTPEIMKESIGVTLEYFKEKTGS